MMIALSQTDLFTNNSRFNSLPSTFASINSIEMRHFDKTPILTWSSYEVRREIDKKYESEKPKGTEMIDELKLQALVE